MRTISQKIIAKIFNNRLGRWYFDVPTGKKIYLITRGSAHYYTGDIAKNGLPIICTTQSVGGRNTFINWLETWKPIHLCWLFIKMGWKIPKYFIGANTAATSPGTMADDSAIGTLTWSDPDNAKASDNVYATATNPGPGAGQLTTHYLKATNFGFAIPTGNTISGILVEVEGKANSASSFMVDNRISIVKADGTIGTTNKKRGSPTWSNIESYISYGGSSDLWGETWDDTKINDIDFGVAFAVDVKYFVSGCLDQNSLISTPNGLLKIKDLKIGDSVLSYNKNTKKVEQSVILNVWSTPISKVNNRYFYIYVNGKIVKATENHEFYANGSYIRADELKIGDILLDETGKECPIEKIEIVENTTDLVWDITVKDNYNFFANDILVHNNTAGIAYVDHIRITVYYTAAAAPNSNFLSLF